VHDIADLEGRGVPSMFVASTEFTDAAAAQVRSFGLDVRRVFVPHPIQDRTDDELRALAEAAVDEILATLTAS
jgi:hypothetical protein